MLSSTGEISVPACNASSVLRCSWPRRCNDLLGLGYAQFVAVLVHFVQKHHTNPSQQYFKCDIVPQARDTLCFIILLVTLYTSLAHIFARFSVLVNRKILLLVKERLMQFVCVHLEYLYKACLYVLWYEVQAHILWYSCTKNIHFFRVYYTEKIYFRSRDPDAARGKLGRPTRSLLVHTIFLAVTCRSHS